MNKLHYFAYRTVLSVATLMVIVTLLFFMFRLMPGDMADFLLNQGASPGTVEAFEERWGLNKPLHIQYLIFLEGILHGDLGTSMRFGVPVTDYIAPKIFNTAILVAPAITTGYIVGAVMGIVFGTTKNETFEHVGLTLILSIGTIPIFFLAILFVILFAGILNWFPSASMVSTETLNAYSAAPWWRIYLTQDFVHHYVLPFTVIALRYSYLPTLLMRTNLGDILNRDFALYHRVTGLPKWRRLRHIGKHASLPLITYYPLSMTRAIGGMVLVEIVFNWPGIGLALVQSVIFRDIGITQAVFMLIAAAVILGNYFVDIVYGFIDPRVSVSE